MKCLCFDHLMDTPLNDGVLLKGGVAKHDATPFFGFSFIGIVSTQTVHTQRHTDAQQAACSTVRRSTGTHRLGAHAEHQSGKTNFSFLFRCSSKSGNISNSGGKTKFLIVTTSYGVVFTTLAKR